jgi:hypothetical protein
MSPRESQASADLDARGSISAAQENGPHTLLPSTRLSTESFPMTPYANRWIYQPNRAFAERAPRDLLLTGSFTELVILRQYLEDVVPL